ncbi:MAG: 2,3-bisphosphoglycerate-dependent phosphoglycerate mutase [Candidatus Omnitrophica bacterium]|nr:2,3-bisphosphoglycerate-dependent phosphoglycerate mutase [Candidatus Omnitrophota bacterium]
MALLVLIRHGQSQWNLENRFTGWIDIPLTDIGREEARKGAEKIKGTRFAKAFTSALIRAHQTLDIVLEVIGQKNIPVEKDQALNERHYGALQGLNKDEMKKKFGEEQVKLWRRSYDVAPPNGESLKDTAARTLPYFKEKILPEVKAGKNILVSAHGNSLRSIVMDLDKLTEEEVVNLEIATGAPIVYEIDPSGKILKKTVHALS